MPAHHLRSRNFNGEKMKRIGFSLFCLSAFVLAASPELMNQQDLQTTWIKGNPNYKVEFSEGKCTATCLKNERRPLAVQSRRITDIKPGTSCRISFQARGTVENVEFYPQFNGNSPTKSSRVFFGFSTTGTIMRRPLKFPETARRSVA